MSIFRTTILAVLALWLVSSANGQSAKTITAAQLCPKTQSPKLIDRSKIVSFGVLNGRAVKLVRPEYPQGALAVNVRGIGEVSVLVDKDGCVAEPKALSGHPLLIPASINAAKESIFEPVTISGHPVIVYGIITYKNLPVTMNWLEIGYYSDSIETIISSLPPGFEVQVKLYEQTRGQSFNERQAMSDSILTSISEQIKTNQTASSLFTVGQVIRKLERYEWDSKEAGELRKEIRRIMDGLPVGINSDIRINLENLLEIQSGSDVRRKLKRIRDKFYYLGS